jgi:GNAT superfamily N-acetyltransferase
VAIPGLTGFSTRWWIRGPGPLGRLVVMTDVRSAGQADLGEIGRVLGRAFAVDPVMSWLFPGADRERHLATLFALLAARVHNGPECVEIATAGGRTAGVSMWDAPTEVRSPSVLELALQCGYLRLIGGRSRRQWAMSRGIDAARPRQRHWYLAILGTEPDLRGTGAGRALLNSRLDRCDAAGLPAYLESSSPANVPYYEKSGFRVRGEIALPGGPTLYPMWRDPEG